MDQRCYQPMGFRLWITARNFPGILIFVIHTFLFVRFALFALLHLVDALFLSLSLSIYLSI